MQKVNPNWSGEARLPQTIRLPVQIANALYGVGSGRREIVVRQDGEVPSLIIEWMHSEPRYRTWFLQGEAQQPAEDDPLKAVSATTGDEIAVAKNDRQTFDIVEEMVEALDDKPKQQRRKKSADKE